MGDESKGEHNMICYPDAETQKDGEKSKDNKS